MAEFNHAIVKVTTSGAAHIKFPAGAGLHTQIKVTHGATDLPVYTGDYQVTPTQTDVILPTKNKALMDDVTVFAIPYSESTNPSGGLTVNIG